MSYAIGTVFFGVPLTEEMKCAQAELEQCEESDLDQSSFEDHFEMLYTQGDGLAGYCGVQVNTFDECEDVQLVSDFVKPFKATKKQQTEARKKIEALPAHLKKLTKGKIGLYLIWSSS